MTAAVFLDRDGVVNRERGFVTCPAEFELTDGIRDAVRELDALGFRLLIVTNQSGIARGLYDWSDLNAIHHELRAALPEIDGIYVCPHHPSAGTTPMTRACPCRKPKPGMLVQAAREHRLELASSWLIGDAARDIVAAQAAGVRSVLVTGEKLPSKDAYPDDAPRPEAFVGDVREAAAWIRARPAGGARGSG